MPWEGYNFEDAILISDKVAQAYSTVYIEEFSIKLNQNGARPLASPGSSPTGQSPESVLKIIEPKSWVNPGDTLVLKKRKIQNNRLRPSFLINKLILGMLTLYIASSWQIQVGDKMSGRHGNKGIVSKILPFYDMPYLIDGTPIEIVLNPLGVPSRMNVGQIYESLLNLVGFYKNEYFRIPPFDENLDYQFSRNFVYWQLNQLNWHQYTNYMVRMASSSGQISTKFNWGLGSNYLEIKKLSLLRRRKEWGPRDLKNCEARRWKENLMRFSFLPHKWNSFPTNPGHKWPGSSLRGRQLSHLPSKSLAIQIYSRLNILSKAGRLSKEWIGLNPYFPGKMWLFDGKTGETFFRPIIVGKSYMLKLNHLVDQKIHARATGPYALITQQPLKGKRNQGGQWLGEMEVWALYAFGSASILFETLTIKSDDPVGWQKIIREIAGIPRNDITRGIPEAFRVLIMSLRALCLNLTVFKESEDAAFLVN
uniref:RNA polymerase beta subunit n=1 Tax=Cephaleuros parasiticus TaxID=173370 RepID=UPI001EDE574D|nr:RNA polymerase beta subunit [Cephaleuros parasiticus]UIB38973.1 RNA polymerase beta subunit [Cephaleuros parasiticus]